MSSKQVEFWVNLRPLSCISLLEEKHGKVDAVTMEVNGQLIIKPIIKEAEADKQQ